MSYTKDLLKVAEKCPNPDEDGECPDFLHCSPMDTRTEGYDQKIGVVFLPHSCDEWVIGGPEEIQLLIDDLTKAYVKLTT